MNTAGIWSESIHGDKEQWERQKSLDNFTQGKAKCIVATDVAARGLDIKGVSHHHRLKSLSVVVSGTRASVDSVAVWVVGWLSGMLGGCVSGEPRDQL